MQRGSRILITVFALALTLAANAFAAGKDAEFVEKKWNPLAGENSPMADIAEAEPNNSLATAQLLGCGNILRPATISTSSDTDYVAFTATAGTIVTIGTDADGSGTLLGDSRIRLFDENGVVLASDDDSGPGAYSLLTYTVGTSGTFYVGIAGYSSAYTGDYKAFITCVTPEPPPANDNCAGALPIECGTVALSGSTQFATNDFSPVTAACTGYSAAGKDVVYFINAGGGDSINLTYNSAADGSIYLLTNCADPASCVAGADEALAGADEVLTYTFPATGVYYLVLDNYGTGAGGAWTLAGDVSCNVVPAERTSWGKLKTIYR